MYHVVDSKKSFTEAAAALEEAVTSHGFGVLHVHDIGATLRTKGMPFDEECKVFEVCQPAHAHRVLSTDMRLNMALPCRISVYTENGATRIGMLLPTKMLAALSQDPALAEVAREVEDATCQMIQDAS